MYRIAIESSLIYDTIKFHIVTALLWSDHSYWHSAARLTRVRRWQNGKDGAERTQIDEEGHFGLQIAATLRRLTNRQKALAKLQIHHVLINIEVPDENYYQQKQPYYWYTVESLYDQVNHIIFVNGILIIELLIKSVNMSVLPSHFAIITVEIISESISDITGKLRIPIIMIEFTCCCQLSLILLIL